jgi:DNA-binding transcriptional MerR regulator
MSDPTAVPLPLMTPAQVLAELAKHGHRASSSSLRYWVSTGRLAATRSVGGHRRYAPAAVAALIAALAEPEPSA